MDNIYQPGNLVNFRGRDWIVLPSDDPELIMVKPLGGGEEEVTAIMPELDLPGEEVKDSQLPDPSAADLGDFETAKLLFDANRLSFRNASGPFRCMGKLSFRPRSYQIVPLVMALKQDIVRLLVADDVGIGKTVEALIILQEMLGRGEVKRFAVICPPHLCEQWHQELRDKLDIEAEIVRTSTAAALDRRLPDDRSVFYHLPYQVISIDYIKSDRRRGIFLEDCPGLVIVDEAHTCTQPAGSTSIRQQQRYYLLHDIAKREGQHLILLTATPHSGKDPEFQSLLGLLRPEFEQYDLSEIGQNERRKIARHFIQRKRENIKRWLNEVTPFPERDSKEIAYSLTPDYLEFYNEVLQFARGMSRRGSERSRRIRYWAALALLRGVMSSPGAGLEMLRNRYTKKLEESELEEIQRLENPLIEKVDETSDVTQAELVEHADLEESEILDLSKLFAQAQKLFGPQKDRKLRQAIGIVENWIKGGYQPIIFCRYIATADYVGEYLREALPKKVHVEVITSELADEQRKERVRAMEEHDRRVLVATDCLSEGINLQDYFTAVLHYDLPWNPNRLEQREGRVDRFGQMAEEVKAYLIWGKDNPIDAVVLRVLIQKVRDIQKATGVSITLGEDNKTIVDAVLNEVLLEPDKAVRWANRQLELGFDGTEGFTRAEASFTNELKKAAEKAKNLRSIFAHESVKPEEIETELREVDEAIGDVQTVESLVLAGLRHLGVIVEPDSMGYNFNPINLPPSLKPFFSGEKKVYISFESPTPRGYRYIGRNHRFVEQLCQFLIALAFEEQPPYHRVARTAVVQTDAVEQRTTLVQFRVRNVIKEVRGRREVISEEMYLWGYQSDSKSVAISYEEAKQLLKEARSLSNLSPERQAAEVKQEMEVFKTQAPAFIELAEERAKHLVEAHGRFKTLVGGHRYEAVYPVLPPDVMGVYILLPKPQKLF